MGIRIRGWGRIGGVWGLGFRDWGQGSGFRGWGQGLRIRVWSFGSGFRDKVE